MALKDIFVLLCVVLFCFSTKIDLQKDPSAKITYNIIVGFLMGSWSGFSIKGLGIVRHEKRPDLDCFYATKFSNQRCRIFWQQIVLN
jgi:hypothetical protein